MTKLQIWCGLCVSYLYMGSKPFGCLTYRKMKRRLGRIWLRKGKPYKAKQTLYSLFFALWEHAFNFTDMKQDLPIILLHGDKALQG